MLLAGCGGNSDTTSTTGGGGTGGGGGRLGATVNLTRLPTQGSSAYVLGQMETWFLPGQGRAIGDVTAHIRRTPYLDTNGEQLDLEDKIPQTVNLLLNGYNAQKKWFPVKLGTAGDFVDRRTAVDFVLQVDKITIEDDSGQSTFPAGDALAVDESFPGQMDLSVFPGRVTALQIFLNDAILNYSSDIVFDKALFLDSNLNPGTNKFQGFISDYVMFDISKMANRPLLSSQVVAGKPASKVFISGDGYAISVAKPYDPANPNPSQGVFEVLTPFGHLQGIYRPPNVDAGGVKTYEIQQADPSDFTFDGPIHLITALNGYYRDYTEVLADMGAQEMLLFPKTGDGSKQELITIVRDTTQAGAPIVDMYFGEVDFGKKDGQGRAAPQFRMYPISQLSPASVSNEVKGSVSLLTDEKGLAVDTRAPSFWQEVRAGKFTVTSAPVGFPTTLMTGRTTVFRL